MVRGLMVVVVGCATAQAPPVAHVELDGAPIVDTLAAPITFGPIAHPAASYDEPLAAQPSDPRFDAVFTELQAGTAIARDPRLDATCTELADVALHGAPLSDALVEFALHEHGVVERGHAFVAYGASASGLVADLVPQLGDQLRFSNTRVGIGGGDPVVVIVVYTAPVTFIAAPREVRGGFELSAVLSPAFHDPRVTVTYDTRSIEQLQVAVDGTAFRAPFRCNGHTGTQWLTVEAADEQRPLAVIPISCAEPPPSTFRIEPSSNTATRDVGRRLIAIINRERAAAHVPPLRTDPRATTAAQRYSETMRAAKDVAHDLAATTPAARLRAVGRVPLFVSESTLQAESLSNAIEILLNDPLYREQVEATKVTHLGIGVATDSDGELFVAIDYVQIPDAIDLARVTRHVADQFQHSGRTRRTVGPVRRRSKRLETTGPPNFDEDLSKIAQQAASDLSLGRRSQSDIERELSEERRRYGSLDVEVKQLADPDAFDFGQLAPEGSFVDSVGVGVAQSSRDGPLGGWIWVVVIFGHY